MAKKLTVTVVGGGVSGMTAALILARFGHEVTLVERSPVLGLSVRGFFRGDAYFDTGLHSTGGLGENGPFTRYLRFLGLELPTVSFEPDGYDTIRFAAQKRDIVLNMGHDAMKERLCEFFPAEVKGLEAYFAAIRKVYGNAPFLNEPTDIRASLAEEAEYDTLAGFLKKRIGDPMLLAVLSISSLIHGSPPEEISFLQHARIVASAFDSVKTFEGGGLALVKAYASQLALSGVRVITGNGVSRINLSPAGAVDGITLDDGGMFDADTVIYTGHPYFLIDIVGEGAFTAIFARHLQTLDETPSAYILFGTSDAPVFPENRSNLFYCPDMDITPFFKEKHDASHGPFFIMTRPGIGVPHADGEGRATGEGCSVSAFISGDIIDFEQWKDTVSGERGADYAVFKTEMLGRFREALVKACPEAANVRFIDGATPLTLRDHIHSLAGSVYGRRHTLAHNNPQPQTRIPGLWLAGQSIVAPGVLGAVISAFLACGFIVGPENLHAGLKN